MVAPASIDDVEPGQPVSMRFSACDANTTPECKGTVQRVSADLIKDQQRKISYFVGGRRSTTKSMPAWKAATAWHACGGPHSDRRSQRLVLRAEALSGQVHRAFRE
ncbi:HlyD family secretion protein [Mesorhizobium sp. LMG17149]|nr:HlyD family secretion protein [Mesorhizobium sp. LMG17149]RUU75923.1 hypothetical protein EOC06_28820 [Mesorhizobium sp. M7A.F.Ca.MR.362.00.0.0]RUV17806.1 hypothetical protein EOB80_25395 [Mesorhizobium sp. M7A.F.Ca.MR.245.00.0.0]RUV47951.1 hypothetical protein EOB77_25940 [Mesorhizobium sp. M7A.F.Ca.MR.228.00.0.0]RWN24886.1 MAG: hypothetical protein EOR97_32790 [Mesorhizobium sp.]MCQ8873698.1 HlyD family secretion protein [Mesorhizobium sp. LMG17149]